MSKVYIYEHHQGFDLILCDRELTSEELYCSHCNESDTLLKVTSDLEDLKSLLSNYGIVEGIEDYEYLINKFNEIVAGGSNDSVNSKETI